MKFNETEQNRNRSTLIEWCIVHMIAMAMVMPRSILRVVSYSNVLYGLIEICNGAKSTEKFCWELSLKTWWHMKLKHASDRFIFHIPRIQCLEFGIEHSINVMFVSSQSKFTEAFWTFKWNSMSNGISFVLDFCFHIETLSWISGQMWEWHTVLMPKKCGCHSNALCKSIASSNPFAFGIVS